MRRAAPRHPPPNLLYGLLLCEVLPGVPREAGGEGVNGASTSHAATPARIRGEMPSMRRRPRLHPGARIRRSVPVHFRSMQGPGHALPKEGKQDLRLRCHYPLGILWRVDRMRYGRGEGGVMSGPVVCRRSPIVHANCDTCGQKPEVIHKPTNSGGACYCGDCCPVCKGASQRRRESDPECFQPKLTHGVCAKCGEDASPVHLPSGYIGRYCEKCCPRCAGKPAAKRE